LTLELFEQQLLFLFETIIEISLHFHFVVLHAPFEALIKILLHFHFVVMQLFLETLF
jgi:hypothetical protein